MMRLPRHGIVFRSILITVLAFLVASVGSISYIAYSTGERVSEKINTRLTQLLDTVQSTTMIACFLNDKGLAREVALGLLSNSEVLRVTISARDVGGTRLMLADETRQGVPESGAEAAAAVLERQIASPFSPGQITGVVKLSPNPGAIASLRNEEIILATKQLALQLALVAAVVVFSLVVFFVRPISRTSQALHQMDPLSGARLRVPPGHANTELGQLVRDVNELSDHLVAALEEAQNARQAAEAASGAKSMFLANMSHEIRTPLNGVLGLAQIGYRESVGRGKAAATFARIVDSGKLLLAIINDILDFSKIEAGKLGIESVPVDPRRILDEAASSLAERAREKGIAICVEKAPDLPPAILGDPVRLSQILLNLLSNAVKFTDRGEVRLGAGLADGRLVFSVTDSGIGMNADQVERLFSAFEQADSSTTRKYGGTGLGLTISQRLAALMGGQIHVVSTPALGSRFELRLPCIGCAPPVAEPAALPAGGPVRLDGVRILVAEDNEVNQLVLNEMLSAVGAQVTLVGNGRQALEAVERAAASFDLVLMDMQMPEMDGLEATRRIRSIAPELPIVGQTAHALAEEHEKCRAAGMCATLTKPLDCDTLVAAVSRYSRHAAVAQPGAAAETAPAASLDPAPPANMLDWAQLEARYGSHPGFVAKLLGIALTSHGETPVAVRTAAAAADMDKLAFLAHTLKSTGGNLFATELQAQARAAELAARAASPDVAELAEQLAVALEAVLAEIRQHLA